MPAENQTFVAAVDPFKACIYGLPTGVPLAKRLGHFIQFLRFSRTELAEATQIAAKTISRWETGEEDARDSSLAKLEIGARQLLRDSRFTAEEATQVARWLAWNSIPERPPEEATTTAQLPIEYRTGDRLVILAKTHMEWTNRKYLHTTKLGSEGSSSQTESQIGDTEVLHAGKLYNVSAEHWRFMLSKFPGLADKAVQLEGPTMMDIDRSQPWDPYTWPAER